MFPPTAVSKPYRGDCATSQAVRVSFDDLFASDSRCHSALSADNNSLISSLFKMIIGSQSPVGFDLIAKAGQAVKQSRLTFFKL
jgi:hypothetical protein